MLFFEIPHFFRYFWLGEESQSENRIFLMKYFLTEVTTIVLEGIQFQLSWWTTYSFKLYLGLGTTASKTDREKELELL